MVLSEHDILKAMDNGLSITPFNPHLLQPASLDVTLSNQFRLFHDYGNTLDVKEHVDLTELVFRDSYTLHPGEFILASTVEKVCIPNWLVAQLMGKSTLGRMGLMVHITAGFIDPGFCGQITLEIANVNRIPIRIHAGMAIGQLSFTQLSSPCEHPYGPARGNHYQGQEGVTAYAKGSSDEHL